MLFKSTDQLVAASDRLNLNGGTNQQLKRLRSVVLLAGSVRANELRKATGRCSLEMPVGNRRSMLDCWREELVALAERLGLEQLHVRVMVDQASQMGKGTRDYGPVRMSIETDPSEFRGTGGLLSDLAKGYEDDDLMLVTHASQLLFEPLTDLFSAVSGVKADVGMVCSQDGTPSGLTLIRCGCLRDINPVGFVDLNEQALPLIAKNHHVRVVRFDRPTSRSLRTLSSYLGTLREYHLRQSGRFAETHGALEEWQPSFGIVEDGASVHETAVVHDSVVLGGARVEPEAVLVRCLVCPGAVVVRGTTQMDAVVGYRP